MLKAEFVQLGFADEDSERGQSATAADMLSDAQLNTVKTVTFCLYVQTFINEQSLLFKKKKTKVYH